MTIALSSMRRFSLTSLFAFVAGVSLALGLFMSSVRRQRDAVDAILSANIGASVAYDDLEDGLGSYSTSSRPPGLDYLSEPTGVELVGARNADALCPQLARLRSLRIINLGGSDVSDAGLLLLAKLPELRTLGLSHTRLTDEGVRELGGMNSLEVLYLMGADVTDDGVAVLGKLRNLKIIGLTETRITNAGVERLRKLLPKCMIHYDANRVAPEPVGND